MPAARPLVTASLVGLAAAVLAALLQLAGTLQVGRLAAFALLQAHAAFATFAFLLPAFAAMTVHSLEALLGRSLPETKGRAIATLWLSGSAILGLTAAFVLEGPVRTAGLGLGALVLVAASGMTTGGLLRLLPKRRESVVDATRDPLTKGDDASLAHLRFAQFFLPLSTLMYAAAGPWWAWEPEWMSRVSLAGVHLLAAHALVSCYGLAHLWVPRLSGVPAIAAGAIKGELHSTLLGVVLLVAGFLSGLTGLLIAGGAFAFLGAFTFMGVIGANIMRNKSRTQRVTPEFTYVPWAFSAVFWLLSGVLLGIFLNVVPDLFEVRRAALRFTHVHIALLGGAAQLLLALAWRVVPAARGVSPPPFQRGRWAFWALNVGLAVLLVGRFRDDVVPGVGGAPYSYTVGALLVAIGLGASFMTLRRHGRGHQAL